MTTTGLDAELRKTPMHPTLEHAIHQTRRQFLTGVSGTLGLAALSSLLNNGGPSLSASGRQCPSPALGLRRNASSRQGAARHLPHADRGADARRSVRLQAEHLSL